MTAPTAPAPGYYADPLDAAQERWWDGAAWTETVRPAEPAAPAVAAVAPVAASVAAHDAVPERAVPERVIPIPALAADPLPAPKATVISAPLVEQPAAEPSLPAQPSAPAVPPAPTVPAGLYPDPYGQAPLRWWDGRQWTTRTSDGGQPVPGGATILPGGAGIGGPVHNGSQQPAYPHRPGLSGPELIERLSSVARAFRSDRRLLAGVLVAVLVLGAGGYLALGRGGSKAPAPAAIASAVNLRITDLPTGWSVPAPDSGRDDPDPAGDELQRNLDRCLGAPDHAASLTFTADSPTWAHGNGDIASSVDVLRSRALVQQDLRAQQSAAVPGCVARVATPALRKALAGEGLQLTGLSITRLPNAPADGFALRLKLTLLVQGRTLVMYDDNYGFVRGNVEVSLDQSNAGSAPDQSVALRALTQLQARATAEIPSSS
jgi:hypothetical protein